MVGICAGIGCWGVCIGVLLRLADRDGVLRCTDEGPLPGPPAEESMSECTTSVALVVARDDLRVEKESVVEEDLKDKREGMAVVACDDRSSTRL